MKDLKQAAAHRAASLRTPTRLTEDATRDIAAALTTLLADVFALAVGVGQTDDGRAGVFPRQP